MAIDTKQANKQQLDKDDAEKISLVDIEELRKALGAEANISVDSIVGSEPVMASTVMCPSHPWDQGGLPTTLPS
jgi:hypothetical protein